MAHLGHSGCFSCQVNTWCHPKFSVPGRPLSADLAAGEYVQNEEARMTHAPLRPTAWPAKKTRGRLARKHFSTGAHPAAETPFYIAAASVSARGDAQCVWSHESSISSSYFPLELRRAISHESGLRKLHCSRLLRASCSLQAALRKCSEQVALRKGSAPVAPCKRFACALCKLVCASCSAQVLCAIALCKLLCASCSAQVTLRKLLCASAAGAAGVCSAYYVCT